MKTLVILNETQFFITVVQGCESSLYKPGYICKVNGKTSKIFSNSSAAITSTYQEILAIKAKFSGSLIMGHDKPEINQQNLVDVTFHPFNCMFSNIQLLVYGVDTFIKEQRGMQAWRAMLTHAGCTNITLFNKDKSSVSHIINVFFMSEINFFTHIIIYVGSRNF